MSLRLREETEELTYVVDVARKDEGLCLYYGNIPVASIDEEGRLSPVELFYEQAERLRQAGVICVRVKDRYGWKIAIGEKKC